MKRKRTTEDWVLDIVIYTVMILVLFLTIYPFYYVFVLSLNDGLDAYKGGIFLWPRKFTWENYRELLSDSSWLTAIFISVSRTVVGTFLGVLATSIVSFALSFDRVIGRKVYTRLYVFTMYFGGGLIPFYILLRTLGMINTFAVYVIPGMLNVYYLLIMRSFYQGLPESLYESARLDGASDIQLYLRIALPLSKAVLVTIALFFAVGQWNSWMDAVYYITKDELRPIAYKMMEIIKRNSITDQADMMASAGLMASSTKTVTTTSLQMAALIIGVLPILCVYPFLQKHFVKGVLIGSVKG